MLFNECDNLATVNFAATNNVTYIYSEAFMGCTSLAFINLPSKVVRISQQSTMMEQLKNGILVAFTNIVNGTMVFLRLY